MSRLWKSELRLDLRIGGCQAEMRGAGWKRRVIASASAAGTGAAAISAALSALQLVDDGALLPADARLTVADEYVCYALLDAQVSTQHALDEATQQFSTALGREDLVVQVSPLPAGNGWLAAAVLETDLHAWADALADAGVRLEHLHPALVQDLTRMADHIREDDATIALLRDNGATLVRLEGGVPAALAWEPFDVEDRGALDRRLQTFVHNTSPGPARRMGQTGPLAHPVAIYLYTNTRGLSQYGAAADEDVLLDPRRRRSMAEPSSFEQALARNDPTRPQPAQRRPAPQARSAGRSRPGEPPARTLPTLVGPADTDVDMPGRGRSAAGTPGAVALAALATRLRQALERSRARRKERRRLEAELNDEELQHKDFSPTGSVLPDEWQDTVQSPEGDAATKTSGTADSFNDDEELDLLATLEAEQALELAFMREDEIPSSAWQRTRPPAEGYSAAATPATPGAGQERRRPLPATLVWPAPTLERVEPGHGAPGRPVPGGAAALPEPPQLVDEVMDADEHGRQAAAARAYDGVERRRSHRA